jgi:hypothetical protein
MMTTHPDIINADLLAFIRGEVAPAEPEATRETPVPA